MHLSRQHFSLNKISSKRKEYQVDSRAKHAAISSLWRASPTHPPLSKSLSLSDAIKRVLRQGVKGQDTVDADLLGDWKEGC
jgi:hypothetical protein